LPVAAKSQSQPRRDPQRPTPDDANADTSSPTDNAAAPRRITTKSSATTTTPAEWWPGFGEVDAGDLEAVEEETGTAGVDIVGGDEMEDFGDGVLDAGALGEVGGRWEAGLEGADVHAAFSA
jgi:hypothetical protein